MMVTDSLIRCLISAAGVRPALPVLPQITTAAAMYQQGPRPLRAGYGFAGDAGSGAYPLTAGMHPGSMFGASPQPLKSREISFDTSSKEPHLLRARVFVGNINTNTVTRDDIIRLFSTYGTILGVTVFKGYAFIQYSDRSEADVSVSILNGYKWNGSILDVKLAIAGMKSHNVSSAVTSTNGVKKRLADSMPYSGTEAKKERTDHFSLNSGNSQNEHNSLTGAEDCDGYSHLAIPDILICGGCRFVTSDFERFRDHRKGDCSTSSKPEDETSWQCSMCDENCSDGGALIEHVDKRHNIKLLKKEQ